VDLDVRDLRVDLSEEAMEEHLLGVLRHLTCLLQLVLQQFALDQELGLTEPPEVQQRGADAIIYLNEEKV